jgi:hypothetical protein
MKFGIFRDKGFVILEVRSVSIPARRASEGSGSTRKHPLARASGLYLRNFKEALARKMGSISRLANASGCQLLKRRCDGNSETCEPLFVDMAERWCQGFRAALFAKATKYKPDAQARDKDLFGNIHSLARRACVRETLKAKN